MKSEKRRSWAAISDWQTDDRQSYGSLAIQLQEAGEEAGSLLEFIWQITKIFATGAWIGGVLVVLLIVTLLMSYFGVKYLDECPLRKEIPVYLLVGGSCGLLLVVILLLKHRRQRKEDEGLDDEQENGTDIRSTSAGYTSTSARVAELLLTLFLVGWFAVGNYWVFSIYQPPFYQSRKTSTPNQWCDRRLYLFAVTQILFTHALMISFVLLILITLCCVNRYIRRNRV